MVRDRSSEFRRKAQEYGMRNEDTLERGSISDEPSNSFFSEVGEVRTLIESLSNDIIQLKNKQSAILAQAIVESTEKEQLDEYIAAIRHRSGILKPRLLQMKKDLEYEERRVGAMQGTGADLRIRRHHVESLIKKLSDVLEMFAVSQNDYRQRVSKRVKRQLELVGENPTETEINEMMDSKSTQIFYRDVTTAAARSVLADAKSRHNEILKLENSIAELNEMYSDLAFLVQSQGEMVDRIEDNVEEATNYVHEGREQTRVAVEYKKSAMRKKFYCGILTLAVILIIIAIILILVFVLKK